MNCTIEKAAGLVSPGTALARAADLAGTTECGRTASTGQCRDSVTYSWPERSTLDKSWMWMPTPDTLRGPSLPRIAHHEAGHAVLMQWIGLGCARAVASATKGQAFFPDLAEKMRDLQQPADPTGELAATAAAVFAAGMMAEMIFTGSIWTGPMFRNEQSDCLVAEEMLRPAFGAKSSAGHAWAQRAALHVLHGRWAEVQAIAADLIERGEWHAAQNHFTVGDVATVSMVREAITGSEARIAPSLSRSVKFGGARIPHLWLTDETPVDLML